MITKKQREEAENLIFEVFGAAEKSMKNKMNVDYYRQLFSTMSDQDFYNFFAKRRLPLRFHMEVFKNEPKYYDVVDALKVMKVPLFEKVNLPYVYINKEGKPVQTQEAQVMYIHIERMKQMGALKSHTAPNIDKRDMKTGLLVGEDKGGKETDREFESLATMGFEYTTDEFARARADAMEAKAQMRSEILSKGYVKDSEIDVANYDSIGKNIFNVYLLGSHIGSNLVDINSITPLTAKNKQRRIERL